MPGFLYYLPNGRLGATAEELRPLGLGYAFERGLSRRQVRGGPDHGEGVILADEEAVPSAEVGYFPDRQEWRRSPAGGFWVGLAPPRPASKDLSRGKQLAGHWIDLLDGRPWLVPIARGFLEEDGELRWQHVLPRSAALQDDGRWAEGDVLPRFAPLWRLAERWEAARFSAVGESRVDGDAQRITFDFSEILDAAVEALAMNYRIGPVEADLLGVLNGESAVAVLDAVIDLPTRVAWIKKKRGVDPAGPNTGGGLAGSIGVTGPP